MFYRVIYFFLFLKASANYFDGLELLADPNFSQGFDVIPSCHSDPTVCVKVPHYRLYNPFSTQPNQTAIWEIAQWASRSNLSIDGQMMNDSRSRGIQWSTDDKRFILFQDLRLQLAVNGFHEYDGHYKDPNAPWVHLLVQQDIGRSRGARPLSEVTELRWNFDIQLIYMDQHIQKGYNPNLHAAIFPIYMTLQNLISGDPEYGKYVWLGINPYDDRVLMSPLYINGDAGTGSLIYSAGFSNFSNESVHSGRIIHVNGDMMPFVRLAIQAAVDRGFLHSNDLSRYFVGGMNLGWEVTGLNIGTVEIGSLSLKQYTSETPRSYEFSAENDSEGWQTNEINRGVLNGKWILEVQGDDPQIISPILSINATVVKKIFIRLINDRLPNDRCQIFWNFDETEFFSEERSVWLNIKNDGNWNEYVIDLTGNRNWRGLIRRIRIDPVEFGNGRNLTLDYIRFSV